jgi:hypothetical protein
MEAGEQRRSAWLGDLNFGGPVNPKLGDPAPIMLISVKAGGFYAPPPKATL